MAEREEVFAILNGSPPPNDRDAVRKLNYTTSMVEAEEGQASTTAGAVEIKRWDQSFTGRDGECKQPTSEIPILVVGRQNQHS